MTDGSKAKKPKPEFIIEPMLRYEFTFAPNDKLQGKGANRATRLRSQMLELMEATNLRYYLCLEYTMPQFGDANNQHISRIHYHGFIRFDSYDDIYSFYVDHWHKLTDCGRIQLNYSPISRLQYWTDYFAKSRNYVPKYLRKINNAELSVFLKSKPSSIRLASPVDSQESTDCNIE